MWACCFFPKSLIAIASRYLWKLNDLNFFLQGKSHDIYDKNVFQYRKFYIRENHRKSFIANIIVDHLESLETQFRTYFKLNIDFKKVALSQKPFWISLSEIDHLSLKTQEEFAEVSSGSNFKLELLKSSWLNSDSELEFSTISAMALNILLPFNTTNLCEVTFSALTHKYQYRPSLKKCCRGLTSWNIK